MRSGDNYDLFISYTHKDGAAARGLNGRLNELGLSTSFDRSAFRPRLRWVAALEDAIGRSQDAAILVVEDGIGNTQRRLRVEKIAVQPPP
jgi:hypothetical protein